MTPEGVVVQAVLTWLKSFHIVAWRSNTVGIYDPVQQRYRKNNSINGIADIIGILPGGRFLAIECKSEKGKLSEDQKNFGQMVRDAGGVYLVVRPDDWEKQLSDIKEFLRIIIGQT
jgi:hypothetical protein